MSRPWAAAVRNRINAIINQRSASSHRLFRRYASDASSDAKAQARISRVTSRMPRFLQRFMQPLMRAPVSHVVSFLVLHEITALVPLVGLASTFHYFDWLPPYVSEGKWVSEGVEKFGSYFRKKGWLGDLAEGQESRRGRWWGRGEGTVRLLVEIGTAWAITKFLLPVRIVASVWAAPWFARTAVNPITNVVRRMVGLRVISIVAPSAATNVASIARKSPSAGTNAIGGGVTGVR